MTVRPDVRDRLVPAAAGWYTGEESWQTCYGTPLRLAGDARRFDASPAWLSWHAAAAALKLFEAAGIDRIHDHDVALANRLLTGLDLEPGDSTIVSFATDDDAARRLASADVKVSARGAACASAATSTTRTAISIARLRRYLVLDVASPCDIDALAVTRRPNLVSAKRFEKIERDRCPYVAT